MDKLNLELPEYLLLKILFEDADQVSSLDIPHNLFDGWAPINVYLQTLSHKHYVHLEETEEQDYLCSLTNKGLQFYIENQESIDKYLAGHGTPNIKMYLLNSEKNRSKVFKEGRTGIKRKIIDGGEIVLESQIGVIKHAVSGDPNDNTLNVLGFFSQGLIGYASTKKSKESIELYRVNLQDSSEQLLMTQESNEKLEEGKFTVEPFFGNATKKKTSLKLHRFHKRGSEKVQSDHFSCTNPNYELLKKYQYKEETEEVYGDVYLYDSPGPDRIPLYVYSNLNEDVRLFDPLTVRVNEKYDYQSFLWSDSATKADELGRESLVKSVTQSINNLFEKYQDAYTVLLNGEWGSGKSSMLNFFETHLRDTGWQVIRYNAWENQKFSDPWWILINKISKYASENSLAGEFTSHRYWKFKLQYKHKILALLLLAVFGVSAYFFTSSVGAPDADDSTSDLGFYSSIVGLVGTFIGAITGLVNNFFYKSVSHEELKQQFTEHPFEPIRKRFNQIAEENNLAIFIDDLDRCDVEATVSLLEGIQNLFKEVRVLYIIAADGQWVSNCFTEKYKDFKLLTNDGTSIGDQFLQKTFQLTLNVPKPDPERSKHFWDKLIGHVEQKSNEGTSFEAQAGLQNTSSGQEEEIALDIEEANRETDQKLADEKEDFKENVEKYLRQFHNQMGDNPRQMKRFVNQYEVTRQTLIVEGKLEDYRGKDDDRTVRFLIFTMQYPSLADKLKKGELNLNDIANTDQSQKPFINLTEKDREEIKGLLEGIDESLIKGDFFSI